MGKYNTVKQIARFKATHVGKPRMVGALLLHGKQRLFALSESGQNLYYFTGATYRLREKGSFKLDHQTVIAGFLAVKKQQQFYQIEIANHVKSKEAVYLYCKREDEWEEWLTTLKVTVEELRKRKIEAIKEKIRKERENPSDKFAMLKDMTIHFSNNLRSLEVMRSGTPREGRSLSLSNPAGGRGMQPWDAPRTGYVAELANDSDIDSEDFASSGFEEGDASDESVHFEEFELQASRSMPDIIKESAAGFDDITPKVSIDRIMSASSSLNNLMNDSKAHVDDANDDANDEEGSGSSPSLRMLKKNEKSKSSDSIPGLLLQKDPAFLVESCTEFALKLNEREGEKEEEETKEKEADEVENGKEDEENENPLVFSRKKRPSVPAAHTIADLRTSSLSLSTTHPRTKFIKNPSLTSLVSQSHSGAISESGELFMWGKPSSTLLASLVPPTSHPISPTSGRPSPSARFSAAPSPSPSPSPSPPLDPRELDMMIPRPVTFPSPNVNVISGSFGSNHFAAITDDGALWTWGENRYAQLGHGDVTPRTSPTMVEWFMKRNEPVASVSCGRTSTLAVTGAGCLVGWGWGWSLGLASAFQRRYPTRVAYRLCDERVVSVSVGWQHALAINAEGRVFSHGQGKYGRLGHDNEDPRYEPHEIASLVTANVVQVAAGEEHSMALTNDGCVFCWGRNQLGQCGVAFREEDEDEAAKKENPNEMVLNSEVSSPSVPPLATSATSTTTTTASTMAIPSDDTSKSSMIRSPSRMQFLALQNKILSPQLVAPLTPFFISSISTTGNHCVAVGSEGQVWTWGDGSWGQLGDGKFEDRGFASRIAFKHHPKFSSEGSDSKSSSRRKSHRKSSSSSTSSASHHHSRRKSSSASSKRRSSRHGSSSAGGVGTGTEANEPVENVKIVSVSARRHNIAVSSNGDLYSWGFGHDAQLGIPNVCVRSEPQKIRITN